MTNGNDKLVEKLPCNTIEDLSLAATAGIGR